jgi:hypothetical protein
MPSNENTHNENAKITMKTKYKILIGVVVLLIVIRLILPYVVLHYANRTLANMKGYYGHIENIKLSVYRGAYNVKNIYLNKIDPISKKQTRFFKSREIDLSIEWKALFHGSIVGKLYFNSPVFIFTKDKVEFGALKKDTTDFRKLLKSFMPLKVNRFAVDDGAIHYVDSSSKPAVDVSLEKTRVVALNLSNATNNKVELPSSLTAHASVYEGTLDLNVQLNALAENPTFDLKTEIKNTNLVLLNDFLKAYGKFDVARGKFSLYTEIAAKGGKFKGYVKPIIKDLKVLGPKDKNDSFFQLMWESIVGGTGFVLKNQKANQVATKIPIEGTFKNPKTNTIEALWKVLSNAFIQALIPNIDYEININSVKSVKVEDKRNFLQKIFSPEKKESKNHK